MRTLARGQFSRRQVLGSATAVAAAAIVGRAAPALSSTAQIDIVHLFSGETHPMQKVINAFNAKQSGVNAISRQEGTTYEAITQKAMTGIAAGKPPALMTTGWKLASFAKRTLGAQDINKIYGARASEIVSNYPESILKLVAVDGALVGVPWAMSTPVLYINMDLWRQAGLDPDNLPTTVEALYPAARQLQDRTGKAGLIYEVNEWLPQAFIQNAGGDVLDAEGRPVMDSDAAVHAITRFIEPKQKGFWQPVGISEMVTAFQSGAIGVMASSSARQSGVRAQAKFDLKLIEMPGIEGHKRRMNSGGNFLAVYARDKEQQQAALEFLKFCGTPEAITIWSETGYLNTSVHKLPVPPGQEASYKQLAGGLTAETIWPGARGFEALKAHIDWISRIVNEAVSVRDGLRGSKEAVAKLIA
jgi:multiple sugar transport system substrate-binding protein